MNLTQLLGLEHDELIELARQQGLTIIELKKTITRIRNLTNTRFVIPAIKKEKPLWKI